MLEEKWNLWQIGLELDDGYSPFQPKPFHNAQIKSSMPALGQQRYEVLKEVASAALKLIG